jgi:hypothetical protein
MKSKIFLFLLCLFLLIPVNAAAQIRFSSNANAYDNNNRKVGTQYIAANITNGTGTMTIGNLKMRAVITNGQRNDQYQMTGYSVTLSTSNGKTVEATVTKHDKGTYNVVVFYADGKIRYDVPASPN